MTFHNTMESKVMILAAFAILTQTSCAQQWSTSVYGLSEEKSARFNGIVEFQKTSDSRLSDALTTVFDMLDILSIKRKYNLRCAGDDYSTYVARALVQAKAASDNTYNAIPAIVQGESVCAVETARIGSHGDLESLAMHFGNAVGLVVSRNYTDIRTQLEPFSAGARTALGSFMRRIYHTLRSCLRTTDAETLALIKVHETESTENVFVASDSMFLAVKVIASGISTETSLPGILPDVNYYRQQGLNALNNYVLHNFGLFRGIFISSQLNKPELTTRYIADQYAQVLSAAKYKEANGLVFDFMSNYLIKIQLGLSAVGDDDFSGLNFARVKSVENLKIIMHTLVDSVSKDDPIIDVTSTLAHTALEFFDTSFGDTAAAAYYDSLKPALVEGLSLEDTLAKIREAKATFVGAVPIFVTTVFGLVQLGRGNLGGILDLEGNSVKVGYRHLDSVFNAAEVLAKARHRKTVTKEDFEALETAANESNSAVNDFTANISSAHVSAINAVKKILQTVIPTVTNILPVPHIPSISTGGLGSLLG